MWHSSHTRTPVTPKAPVARRQIWQWVQFATGAAMILLQVGRGINSVTTFHHYTTWNFMLVGFVLLLGVFPTCDVLTALYLQPMALASTPYVIECTGIMFGLKFGLVEDSLHNYPVGVVHVVNILLHGVPFCFIVIWTTGSISYYTAKFGTNPDTCLALQTKHILFYIGHAAATAFAYSASYFYTFSPQAEYKFETYISNYTARTGSVIIHTGLVLLYAVAIVYFYKLWPAK